jgi:hypothetical protein
MRTNSIIIMVVFLVSTISTVTASTPVLEVSSGQISDVGSTTTLNITLNQAPDGLAGYNITVSLSNASVAEIISVDFPAWAALHSNGPLPSDSVWLKAADLNDQIKSGASSVLLATLTVRLDSPGSTKVNPVVMQMDDDNGSVISASTVSGQVGLQASVSSTSTAAPISTAAPPLTGALTPTATVTSTTTPAPTPAPTFTIPEKEKTPQSPSKTEAPRTQRKTPGFQIILAIIGLLAALRCRNK